MKNAVAFFSLLMVLVGFLTACQGPAPREEYSLARAAIEAARDADAAKFAPSYWHKAMTTYRQARRYYKDRDHSLAKQYFDRSRLYAERAENLSQLARAKGDESF